MNKNGYNGYANYDTWNCSLSLNNDEGLYKMAVDFMTQYHRTHDPEMASSDPYRDFIAYAEMKDKKTGDDISWLSDDLDYEELDQMMWELIDIDE